MGPGQEEGTWWFGFGDSESESQGGTEAKLSCQQLERPLDRDTAVENPYK